MMRSQFIMQIKSALVLNKSKDLCKTSGSGALICTVWAYFFNLTSA